MNAKQPKSNKKAMTLEDFAVAIQRDCLSLRKDVAAGFAEARAEMATKQELRALQGEMRIGFKNLNEDVKMITDTIVSKPTLRTRSPTKWRSPRMGGKFMISRPA